MNKKAIVTLFAAMALFVSTPVAHAATLTEPQIQAIVGLLRAFSVPEATVTNVSNILHGTTSTNATTPSTSTGPTLIGVTVTPNTTTPTNTTTNTASTNGYDNVSISSFTASPSVVTPGQSTTLSWSSYGISSSGGCFITANPSQTGGVAVNLNNTGVSGSQMVTVPVTTTYTLSCDYTFNDSVPGISKQVVVTTQQPTSNTNTTTTTYTEPTYPPLTEAPSSATFNDSSLVSTSGSTISLSGTTPTAPISIVISTPNGVLTSGAVYYSGFRWKHTFYPSTPLANGQYQVKIYTFDAFSTLLTTGALTIQTPSQ